MAFNFGATTAAKPAFGTSATTTSGGLFGGFGGTTTTAAGTGFGFGTGTGAGLTTGGLGTGLGTGTFGTGTGGLGAGTTTGFGTGLGTNLGAGIGATNPTSFGTGFGLQTQQAQQQQHHQQQSASSSLAIANMAAAVSLPVIFGDERDALLAKWNQLQAFWGTGKGFYNQQGQAIDFSPDNPFCRFKAVGYSCMLTTRNRDGLVGLTFRKKLAEVQANQMIIVDSLHKLLGSKPQLSVCVNSVRALPDDKTEMMIYIQERAPTGTTKRITATEVFTFLNQANIKNQLMSLSIENVLPQTGLTVEQLKRYLANPPSGIDPLIWQQARLDNPDPEKLIPVPMIGFKELYKRLRHQEQQTSLHQGRMDTISKDIEKLQHNQSSMGARIEQYKRKHLELSHRVLQVMTKQEVYRKLGYAIQADEEQLRVQLEAYQAELNAPTQFKGRLNELMSQMRMQNQLAGSRNEASYQMDPAVQQEIGQHLKQQQHGLTHLIGIIKDDLEDLQLIEQGLSETSSHSRR